MSDENKPTSERLYGIRPQPRETCPKIDEVLGEARDLSRRIRGYEKASEDELRDMLWAVERFLGQLDGYGRTGLMEDIRRNVTDIRAWGQEWKDYALENAEPPRE